VITHLLDTDVCIRFMKGREPGLVEWFKRHDGHMALSLVSLFELYYGAALYSDPAARQETIDAFAAQLELVEFDRHAAFHAGDIRAKLKRAGQPIGGYDLLIAGIARSRGLVLATNNTREFQRVEGLRLESWP
jgi:tRNA(fMet)-specific endonuclease VapC